MKKVFTILLSSFYSVNMLLQTAIDVKDDLTEDIEKARRSVSYLVSRNTDELKTILAVLSPSAFPENYRIDYISRTRF